MVNLEIVPMMAKINAPYATLIVIEGIWDNLVDACFGKWRLKDADGNDLLSNTEEMSGDDYAGWDGSNSFAISYFVNKVGCTLV